MCPIENYDFIIIGGGPGGYETAAEAAALGLKVALIEKDNLGGTCLNRGCIPTKCLCAAAEQIETCKNTNLGAHAEISFDYAAAHARITPVVGELRDGIESMLRDVTVINGEGCLACDRKVEVGNRVLRAPRIVIATGSTPATLPVPGAEYTMNSDAFLALETMPGRLVVVGGGVIGLEFASVAAAFGSKVTVIEFCREILPGMDADMAKRLRTAMGRRDINLVTDARVTAIDADHMVTYERKGKEVKISTDAVLMAVGRRPLLPKGCKTAGIETDKRGFIVTDDNMQTTAEGIFAIGDVNGRSMLAHSAAAQGRRVLGLDIDLDVIPSTVFTIPQLASVCRRNCGDDNVSIKIPYASVGYALAADMEGMLKLSCDVKNHCLTGCTAIGPHAADLVAQASTAINASITIEALAAVVSAHPGISEILTGAARQLSATLKKQI